MGGGVDPSIKCTFWESVSNLVNMIVGAGLLSIPFAWKSMGWSCVVLLGLCTLLMGHTLDIISRSVVVIHDLERTKEYCDYNHLALVACGPDSFLPRLAAGTFVVEIFVGATSFLILIGINLEAMFGIDLWVGITLSGLLSMVLTQLNAKALAMFSAISVVGTIGAITALIVSGWQLPELPKAEDYQVLDTSGK